jgi:hypothetical protein
MRQTLLIPKATTCVLWKAECVEIRLLGVRREARYSIPAASRRNWGEVPGLLAYLEVKAEGDQACQASGACSKALEGRVSV